MTLSTTTRSRGPRCRRIRSSASRFSSSLKASPFILALTTVTMVGVTCALTALALVAVVVLVIFVLVVLVPACFLFAASVDTN